MADKKWYVCDGCSITGKKKMLTAGAEVSSKLGQERCIALSKAKKPIVQSTKPASLVEYEKAKTDKEKKAAKLSAHVEAEKSRKQQNFDKTEEGKKAIAEKADKEAADKIAADKLAADKK